MFNFDIKSTLFCLACFVVTLLSCGAIYFVVNQPIVEVDYDNAKNRQIIMCGAKFKGDKTQFDLSVARNDDELTFTSNSIESWESQLVMASSILMQCKGMDVEYICFGSECSTGGLELTLSFDDSMVDERINKGD